MNTFSDKFISSFVRSFVYVFMTMLLAAPLVQAADLSWTPEVKIDSFAAGSVGGGSPRIAVDPNGNVMAVWVQSDGTNQNIYANLYKVGTGWGAATLIETSAMPADAPQIAADSRGNFIAVWRQAWKVVNGNNYGIYASRYVAGTGWGAPAVVYVETQNSSVSANADVQIAVDPNGNAVAVWSVYDWSWNHTSVRANRYVVGTGWTGVTNLSTEAVQAASGANVAMDSTGNAMVVWSQDSGTTNSTQGVFADKYTIGIGWGTPKLIESASVAATRTGWGPQVAFDASGNAIAVWYQYTKPGIYANRYVAGAGWGTPVAIADTGTTSYDEGVQLAFDKNGNAIAVWNQYGGVLYANRYVAGSGWGTTSIVESNGTDYSEKAAFDQNGNAIAIWGNSSCNSNNIQAAPYVVGAGWGAMKKCYEQGVSFVNKTLDLTREPQIVIDKNGNATAVWVRGVGGIGSIYASTATIASAPTVTNYMISTTASPAAGGSVTCSPNPVSSGGSSTCTATANSGYAFASWSGNCSATTSTCTLNNVTAQKSVTAVFSATSTQAESTIFDNGNIGGVYNSPGAATVFTVSSPVTITYLMTYHWNNGKGSTVGTIGLKHSDGTMYGPWQAISTAGNNLYWEVHPSVTIKSGSYTVIDSNPSTWSYNSQSGNAGMAVIRGNAASLLSPISNARVFAFAEANYPSLFSTAVGPFGISPTDGQYQQYSYRYYPSTGNYLAVDTSGVIWILGPVSGGNILSVGSAESFRGAITAWEGTQPH